MRRNLIPLFLAVVLVPLTVAFVLRLMLEAPESTLAFPGPTHRLAVAVDEAMKSAMKSVTIGKREFFPVPILAHPVSQNGKLPADLNAFWSTFSVPIRGIAANSALTLVTMTSIKIQGVTKDGRSVEATVTGDPIGEGSLVDFNGDAEAARVLAPTIAQWLAHPEFEHDSTEDREALMIFTGIPKADVKALVAKIGTLPPMRTMVGLPGLGTAAVVSPVGTTISVTPPIAAPK